MNSLEYTMFIRDFAENILLSLNLDYKNYISFKKENGELKNKLDCYELDHTITYTAYNLVLKGKQKLYMYEKNGKIIISLDYYKSEKALGKIEMKLPKQVMTDFKRKRILRKLKCMNYPVEYKQYSEYARDSLYIMDLIKMESEKLTKEYVSVNFNSDKCTDKYTLYREIRKRKYQKILVEHIFLKLNQGFHKYLKVSTDDIVVFNSPTVDELNCMINDLLNDRKTIKEIRNVLYQRL